MKILLTAILLVTTIIIHGQVSIQNVDFTQKGDEIYISYDMHCKGKADLYVYYSINDGTNWQGPVKLLNGDVKSVQSGIGKQIVWNVLEERSYLIAENLKIKILGIQSEGIYTDTRDGQKYKWVRIGDQVWMAENLNYDAGSGSWCYNDNSFNCNKYGRLYTWETAKRVCPVGWHLPSKSEFETLLNRYGGEGEQAYIALNSGGSSGFSVLFGGDRSGNGGFLGMGSRGYFWSSSGSDSDYAWRLYISSHSKKAFMNSHDKSWGFSVRCFHD